MGGLVGLESHGCLRVKEGALLNRCLFSSDRKIPAAMLVHTVGSRDPISIRLLRFTREP